MTSEIELATQVFEFLEDKHHFEYHLKTSKQSNSNISVITYYKDNTTFKLSINHKDCYFNLNIIKERDNSFTITSFLDKLLYQSNDNSKAEFEIAGEKLAAFI